MFETNFFGTFRVIQAVLPFLRQQGSGHTMGVSSGMGIVAVPLIDFYCASKWAVDRRTSEKCGCINLARATLTGAFVARL